MKNPELINRENLLADIAAIYECHYAQSNDQAIHDMYNAVVKRIRRAPNCAAKQHDPATNEKIDCKYLTENGLCLGQNGMPECSPCGPYCPLRREFNG